MINRILEAVLALLLVATVCVAFLAVIFRYVLGEALSWSFEVSLALLTYITFIGGYLALRKGAHLKVDILVDKLPRVPRSLLYLMSQSIIAVIGWIVAIHGSRQVFTFADQLTTVLEISTVWYYAALPIAGALMLIDCLLGILQGIWRLCRGLDADPRRGDDRAVGTTDL